MDQIAAMRSFVQVVDRDGFAAAGRALGLSGPMVGNHVRWLESQLGGLLLNRTTRAQHLTDLGQAYLARCRRILAELDHAEVEAQEMLESPRGRIRMTAPHSIGSTVLPPVIASFARAHPAVHVDLHLDDGRVDLLAQGFDLAIRVGEVRDAALVTRALAPLELVVCAAPEYLARRGEPATPADLGAHDCLDFAGSSTPGAWSFGDAEGAVAISGPLRANSGSALRAAAVAGLGIILQPRMFLRDEIASRRLVVLLERYPARSRPVQLLTLPDRRPTAKLRALTDVVVRELARA